MLSNFDFVSFNFFCRSTIIIVNNNMTKIGFELNRLNTCCTWTMYTHKKTKFVLIIICTYSNLQKYFLGFFYNKSYFVKTLLLSNVFFVVQLFCCQMCDRQQLKYWEWIQPLKMFQILFNLILNNMWYWCHPSQLPTLTELGN